MFFAAHHFRFADVKCSAQYIIFASPMSNVLRSSSSSLRLALKQILDAGYPVVKSAKLHMRKNPVSFRIRGRLLVAHPSYKLSQ
jgi:hypothetical protein